MMLNVELIESILKDADEIPLIAGKFKHYEKEILTYKPPGKWSAAECFDHLLLINQKYIPIFEDIRSKNSGVGDKEFSSSLMGRFLIKSIHPDANRKVRTLASFNPVRSDADLSIIDEYLQQHYILRNYMEGFRDYDLKKIKITSPLSSMVKYNLGDACKIIIYHDLRHLKQAQRAAESYFVKMNEIR